MTDKNIKADGHKSAQPQKSAQDQTALQQRYGSIGIEAVAAACRYSNQGNNKAPDPKTQRIDQRFEQAS